jgi:AcrR family transcriptional regulator
VLSAATRLFSEKGWRGTTLAAVATEAGTAVETVYSAFGSKSQLLTTAIDVAIVGDDEDEPLAERPEFAALGVGARSARLAAAARIITLAHVRGVPLLRALQEAAASDASASARWDTYEADRRTMIGTGLAMILESQPPGDVIDTLWALASPEVFVKLTQMRRWPLEHYEHWLVETAHTLLASSDL